MRIARSLLALAIVALGVPPAGAGDFATLATIGFSADGRVFAFEQFGTRDGSGFPYSEIVFVDLARDAFVKPSPVRVSLERDGADEAMARDAARAKAAPLFQTHRPTANPGFVAADNPATEVSADPHRVAFLPRAIEPSPDRVIELRLQLLPMQPSVLCKDVSDGKSAGFRLTRVVGGKAKVIHDETRIPASRGCPLDYRISRVVIDPSGDAPSRAVAIVGVKSVGFEGPDLRFIAVPVPLG